MSWSATSEPKPPARSISPGIKISLQLLLLLHSLLRQPLGRHPGPHLLDEELLRTDILDEPIHRTHHVNALDVPRSLRPGSSQRRVKRHGGLPIHVVCGTDGGVGGEVGKQAQAQVDHARGAGIVGPDEEGAEGGEGVEVFVGGAGDVPEVVVKEGGEAGG